MFNFQHTVTGSVRTREQSPSLATADTRIDRYTPTQAQITRNTFDEWMPKDVKQLIKVFRTIYKYDGVAGPAIDLIALMPWSDFSLSGIKDQKVLDKYEASMRELHIETLLPELSAEYMIIGYVCASLLFDSKEGIWTDIVPHDPMHLQITPIPLRGHDPKLDLKLGPEFTKFMESKDPRDVAARKEIPNKLLNQLKSGNRIALDPLTTLFVPRRSTVSDVMGSSLLSRILPFYALEKALMSGTIAAAHRRQRAILHISAGESDMWEPTIEELESLTQLFMKADEDPIGSIVATRTGVEVNEVKCLSGETFIHTENGLVTLGSLVKHDPATLPEGSSFELDLSVKGVGGNFVNATHWHYQGEKLLYRLQTDSGFTTDCTKNHKFLALSSSGEFDLVRAKHLIDGDFYVCVESNGPCTEKKLPLGLKRPNVIERQTNADILKPEFMTPYLAYILGLIASDGGINGITVSVRNTDLDILEKYQECLKKVFNLDAEIKPHGHWEEGDTTEIRGVIYSQNKQLYKVEVYSSVLRSYLSQLGLVTAEDITDGLRPSFSYEIPWSIFQANRNSRLAFIGAFIDGDGSVNCRKKDQVEIRITSASEKMLHGFQVLLADMGFLSTVKENHIYIPSSSPIYNEVKRFILSKRKKPFSHCRKASTRKFGIPPEAFIPILESRFIRRYRGGAWFETDEGHAVDVKGGWKYLFRHYIHDKSFLLYDVYEQGGYKEELSLIKKVSLSLYNRLIHIFACKYKFEPVLSFNKIGRRPTYDLTIDKKDRPLFLANGIVTKNSGSDFWKLSDEFDFLSNGKMRALGINESFLSGEANYSTMEIALSVFVEMIRNFRDGMTNRIFYQKLFPLMAKSNEFYKRSQAELDHRIRVYGKKDVAYKDLLIPQINWFKQLRPEADSSYLDILTTIEERGVPIPLRVWASAGGQSLDHNIEMLKDDAKLRKTIKKYKDMSGAGEDIFASTEVITGAIQDMPIFDETKRFMGISIEEAKRLSRKLSKSTKDPNTVVESMFRGSPRKIEAAKVLAKRLGYNASVRKKAVKAAMDHIYNAKRIHGEKATLSEMMRLNSIIHASNGKSDNYKHTIDSMVKRFDTIPVNDPNLYIGK